MQNEFNNYKTQLKKDQDYIDGKEAELMKSVLKEIEEAVKQVAVKGNYHIVLDASTSAGVIYYVTPLDVCAGQCADVL